MLSFSASSEAERGSEAIASKIFLAVSLEIICETFLEFLSFKERISSFSSLELTFSSIPLLLLFEIINSIFVLSLFKISYNFNSIRSYRKLYKYKNLPWL
jgi:hypothetical protein